MKICLATFFLFLAAICVSECAAADSIAFDPSGIEQIRGRSICDFSGTFYERLGVVVGGKGNYSVEYLARDGHTGIFLLNDGNSSDNCGTVLDSRVVITKNPNDVVLFKCRISGDPYKGWGYVVGTGDNHLGSLRYVVASTAWTTDIKNGKFREINGKKVVCDTTGYAG